MREKSRTQVSVNVLRSTTKNLKDYKRLDTAVIYDIFAVVCGTRSIVVWFFFFSIIKGIILNNP